MNSHTYILPELCLDFNKFLTFLSKASVLQPLTIITKRSLLDVAAALDPPLKRSCELTHPTRL